MLSPLLHQLNSSIFLLGYLSLKFSTWHILTQTVRKCVQRVCLPPKQCSYLHITTEAEGDIPMHPIPSISLLQVQSEAL
jgi:hypothetical protein